VAGTENERHNEPSVQRELISTSGRAAVVGTLFAATFWVSKEPTIALAVTALALAPAPTVRPGGRPPKAS
jgi:hypothetical protein